MNHRVIYRLTFHARTNILLSSARLPTSFQQLPLNNYLSGRVGDFFGQASLHDTLQIKVLGFFLGENT